MGGYYKNQGLFKTIFGLPPKISQMAGSEYDGFGPENSGSVNVDKLNTWTEGKEHSLCVRFQYLKKSALAQHSVETGH